MTYIASSRAAFHRPARRLKLSTILAAWRSRQHLKALDARALEDIGLSRAAARAEARRPIWDVPSTWKD